MRNAVVADADPHPRQYPPGPALVRRGHDEEGVLDLLARPFRAGDHELRFERSAGWKCDVDRVVARAEQAVRRGDARQVQCLTLVHDPPAHLPAAGLRAGHGDRLDRDARRHSVDDRRAERLLELATSARGTASY